MSRMRVHLKLTSTLLAVISTAGVSSGETRAQATPVQPAVSLTAAALVDRIKAHVGVEWQAETVDTFKAGDPGTPVKGVAVTMMATLDVLQRAARAGHNLVITHEPTFFDHLDATGALERESDPVLAAKLAFIRTHGLVVWRFHDHWHKRSPDGVQEGMVKALGWERYRTPDPLVFVMPATTVRQLAADVKTRLGVTAMRFVGRPDMTVTRVALLPGAWGFGAHRKSLQRPDVEAVLIGEAQEWETIEYVVDAVAAGLHKALIVPGHVPSEQAGMEECGRWLRGFIT
jgi:putative NIF3 family GTP cyclohydrolase 1 type 2